MAHSLDLSPAMFRKDGGSHPLRNKRHERFAQLLAAPEHYTLVQAYCLSDGSPAKPEPTPGRGVNASKLAARGDVKERIAWLRAERAREAQPVEITVDTVSALMEEITAKYISIQRLADDLGLDELAQKMRRALTIHAGRAERLGRDAPAPVHAATTRFDREGFIERMEGLPICDYTK